MFKGYRERPREAGKGRAKRLHNPLGTSPNDQTRVDRHRGVTKHPPTHAQTPMGRVSGQARWGATTGALRAPKIFGVIQEDVTQHRRALLILGGGPLNLERFLLPPSPSGFECRCLSLLLTPPVIGGLGTKALTLLSSPPCTARPLDAKLASPSYTSI